MILNDFEIKFENFASIVQFYNLLYSKLSFFSLCSTYVNNVYNIINNLVFHMAFNNSFLIWAKMRSNAIFVEW
jgi:hypothetical protein